MVAGGARVSEFFYCEFKFKIKNKRKFFFFGWMRGGARISEIFSTKKLNL